ncbi:hypothetical protein M5689_020764 [Euphorbia peplus]|nr:hypothetical protein M5689_020764 [Euphorbia peplus]
MDLLVTFSNHKHSFCVYNTVATGHQGQVENVVVISDTAQMEGVISSVRTVPLSEDHEFGFDGTHFSDPPSLNGSVREDSDNDNEEFTDMEEGAILEDWPVGEGRNHQLIGPF